MSQTTRFIHMVFFYLPEGSGKDAAEALAEGCRTYLRPIPGVLRLEVGFPAGTPRPVVDNSYAVALIVEFADQAAHDAYQEHADHHRFIEAFRTLSWRVQIYDTLV